MSPRFRLETRIAAGKVMLVFTGLPDDATVILDTIHCHEMGAALIEAALMAMHAEKNPEEFLRLYGDDVLDEEDKQ